MSTVLRRPPTPVSSIVLDPAAWVVVRDLLRVLPLPEPFHRRTDPASLPAEVRADAVRRLADRDVLRQVEPPRLHASLQRSSLVHARPAAVLDLDVRRGDEVVVARLALLRDNVSGLVWRPVVDGSDPSLPVRVPGTVTLVTTTVDHLVDTAASLVPAPDVTPSAREAGRQRVVDAVAAMTALRGHAHEDPAMGRKRSGDDGPVTGGVGDGRDGAADSVGADAHPLGPLPAFLARFAPLTGSMTARVGVPGQPVGDVRWLHDGHDWWEVEPRRDGRLVLRPTGRDRLRDVLAGGLARRLSAATADA